MKEKMKKIFLDESGQGMVEYGLLIALIAIATIVALTALGENITNMFNKVNNTLKVAAPK